MKEIRYWIADDGTKFDDEWDCRQYERKITLQECQNDFNFFDSQKNPIFIENAQTEDICYIIIKTPEAARIVSEWFMSDGCYDPFDDSYNSPVGTWVYSEELNLCCDGWCKLEDEIADLQKLLAELNE